MNRFPLIAVDGGGTKTLAVITDQQGNIVSSYKAGPSNYQAVGKQQAMATIEHVIAAAVNKLLKKKSEKEDATSTPVFQKAVFALAGIDTLKDQEIVENMVQQAVERLPVRIEEMIVENDALSALTGATKQSPGVLIIAGTGSIAFAHDGRGNYVRSGGWGHELGDEGGGYWIGKEAIRSILRMHDGREEPTILSSLILEQLQMNNYEQLYNWVYSSQFSVKHVSSLSRVVDKAFSKGDNVSAKIMDQAVNELYLLIKAVAEKADIHSRPYKLVLLGGILQNNIYIRNELINKVKITNPNVELYSSYNTPIDLIIQRGLYSLS